MGSAWGPREAIRATHLSGPGCSFLRRMGSHQKTHQHGDVAITKLWVGQSGSHAGGRLEAAAVVTEERDGSGLKEGILKTGNHLDFIHSAESGHSPRARHCPPCLSCTSEEIRQNPASPPTQNLSGSLVVSPRDATVRAALRALGAECGESGSAGRTPLGSLSTGSSALLCGAETFAYHTSWTQSVWGKTAFVVILKVLLGAPPCFVLRCDTQDETRVLWVRRRNMTQTLGHPRQGPQTPACLILRPIM